MDVLRTEVILRLAENRGLVADRRRVHAWVRIHSDREVWRQVESRNAGIVGWLRRSRARAQRFFAAARPRWWWWLLL